MLRKTTSHEFKSLRTGCRYKIRQNITCESKDIVYLVTCNKHNIQVVGCTTDLKSRNSNYMNHHKKKNWLCGITEHFLENGHSFEEAIRILPIVGLVNPPVTMAIRGERLEEFELYWQESLTLFGLGFRQPKKTGGAPNLTISCQMMMKLGKDILWVEIVTN